MLGLCCCSGSSLVVASGGYSLAMVHRLLIAVASLVAEHRLWGTQTSGLAAHGLNSCGFQALEHGLNSYGFQALEHGLNSYGFQALEHGLNSCGAWTLMLCRMWDLLRLGIKPKSPALAGRFFTTEPPGKPIYMYINTYI